MTQRLEPGEIEAASVTERKMSDILTRMEYRDEDGRVIYTRNVEMPGAAGIVKVGKRDATTSARKYGGLDHSPEEGNR